MRLPGCTSAVQGMCTWSCLFPRGCWKPRGPEPQCWHPCLPLPSSLRVCCASRAAAPPSHAPLKAGTSTPLQGHPAFAGSSHCSKCTLPTLKAQLSNVRETREGRSWVSCLGWLAGEGADKKLWYLSSDLAQFLNCVKISFLCGAGKRWQGSFSLDKFKLSTNQTVNQIQYSSQQSLYLSSLLLSTSTITNENIQTEVISVWLIGWFPRNRKKKNSRLLWRW